MILVIGLMNVECWQFKKNTASTHKEQGANLIISKSYVNIFADPKKIDTWNSNTMEESDACVYLLFISFV